MRNHGPELKTKVVKMNFFGICPIPVSYLKINNYSKNRNAARVVFHPYFGICSLFFLEVHYSAFYCA